MPIRDGWRLSESTVRQASDAANRKRIPMLSRPCAVFGRQAAGRCKNHQTQEGDEGEMSGVTITVRESLASKASPCVSCGRDCYNHDEPVTVIKLKSVEVGLCPVCLLALKIMLDDL